MAGRWIGVLAAIALSLISMECSSQVREVVRDLASSDAQRLLRVAIWYPEGECAPGTSTLCLDESAVTHKIVVVSHGSMGASDDYAWVGKGLADQGYIVVGLNHFGESRIYGPQTQNLRATGMAWERALDASRALDVLGKQQPFQKPVAWDDAIFIGHSAGGQTAALLAGARFDLLAFARYCRSGQASDDRSCGYAQDVGQAPAAFVSLFNGNYRDPRVRKIVLLDPALGPALLAQSMADSRIPALVVGALHDDFLPWRDHGARYAAAIPQAQTLLLSGNEGHFVFLSVCQHHAAVNGVSLCTDRPGVNRSAVHEQLLSRLISFIAPDDEIPLSGQRATLQNPAVQLTVFDILGHTPYWVFGLFFALCVLGMLQTRTRRVRVSLALLLPVGMLMLSIAGVFQYTSHWVSGLGCWLLCLIIVSALAARFMDPGFVVREGRAQYLLLRGSWKPLLVILGIFITRYGLGVASSLQASFLEHWPVQMLIAGGLGAWSGYFAWRLLRCWQVSRSML